MKKKKRKNEKRNEKKKHNEKEKIEIIKKKNVREIPKVKKGHSEFIPLS